MNHQIFHKVTTGTPKPFVVFCSVCERFIRLSLVAFFEFQEARQTTSFFEAMASEDCGGPR